MKQTSKKPLEENTGSMLLGISISNIFFLGGGFLFLHARETKVKINKWDNIKLKSFFTENKVISKMKSQSNEWEKIFANDISKKGLICNIHTHTELIQLNLKTPCNPIKR